MVMSDVKEEEVVNRITKMAAELHFFGDRSSISGKMENMDDKTSEVDRQVCQDWPKLFSIPYIFYAFALCDSNNTNENLNWRNVNQMYQHDFELGKG